MSATNLVTVATYQELASANLAQSRLAQAGIVAFVANALTASSLGNALGDVKLQVAETDVHQARDVLAQKIDEATLADMDAEAMASDGSLVEGSEEEGPLSERERLAEKVSRGALLSFLCPPFFFLVAYMLFRVFQSEEPLRHPYRRYVWLAALVTIPMVIMMAIFLFNVIAQFASKF